jgi:hypothetical protein
MNMGIEDAGSAPVSVEAEAVSHNLVTKGPKATSSTTAPQDILGEKFSPYDLSTAPRITSGLPPEIWTIIQSAPAAFPPQYFLDVNRNLLENPNLTASHISRAELSYQSFTDATFNPKAETPSDLASIVKHLRPECQPRLVQGGIEGYDLEWTVVRKLIPRNPKLDDSMMQTCHLYTSKQDITIATTDGAEETVQAERYLSCRLYPSRRKLIRSSLLPPHRPISRNAVHLPSNTRLFFHALISRYPFHIL